MKFLVKIITALTLAGAMTLTACGGGGEGGDNGGGDKVINIASIPGVTPPSYGETPVTTITETTQYTGIVNWSDSPVTFAPTTTYTATITLTAKPGYTLTGVEEDFFTVAGAASDTNSADSGVVTAVFPATGLPVGSKETYTADSVTFNMAYVPGGLTFPTGINDDGTATVANAYWIAETEVTYELWNKVYTWATNSSVDHDGDGLTGDDVYTFANAGSRGGYYNGGSLVVYSSGHETDPVTTVNWRDSIVWCNAMTEWYNAQSGASYECVYTYSNAVIRNSYNGRACDLAVAISTARGFRLPTSNEWECAARYRDGILWTYGDHASGDDSGACYDDGDMLGGLDISTVFGNYAWYDGNSGSSTHVVGTTSKANALGLYDMSGNVWEWCFGTGVYRGGCWYRSAYDLQVGNWGRINSDYTNNLVGFRIARSAD